MVSALTFGFWTYLFTKKNYRQYKYDFCSKTLPTDL